MTSQERFRRRLKGEPVDRPPNFDIFMTCAAHLIGKPLRDYYLDYRVLTEANLAVRDAYDLDILQAISDPFRETADFGAKIVFPEDGLPVCEERPLADPERILSLRKPDPYAGGRMTDRLEAIRAMREAGGPDVPVMGWVEGALAESADLRGVSELLSDLIDRPEWVRDLLEICTEVAIDFARAQVEAGADIIGMGDAVASLISPKMYRQYAQPYEQRIVEAIHEAGALARLHICGNTSRIVSDMKATGADVIDLDWMVDFGAAAETYGGTPSLCGNVDPVTVMLQGTPEQVYDAITYCLTVGGPSSISGAGCEIPDGTPAENLHAQAQAIRDFVPQASVPV